MTIDNPLEEDLAPAGLTEPAADENFNDVVEEPDDGPEALAELEAMDWGDDVPVRRDGIPRRRAVTPAVTWAEDAEQPDFAHMLAATDAGVEPDTRFTLTAEVLELLIRANRFQPEGKGNQIVFGLRGGQLTGGDSFEDVDAVEISDTRPDHATFCCTIGVLNRTTGKISAFLGSTVPNEKFMTNYYRKKNSLPPFKNMNCNMLPTGCYIFRIGGHSKNRIRPALRMTNPDRLTEDAVCTVLRTSNDLSYRHEDFWDRTTPYDNIHCAYYDTKFSSAGCQTIKGANRAGPWGRFQAFLDTGRTNTRFDYMLLTGREAAVAAKLIESGKADDTALVQTCLGRLRVGSRGDAVTRLQKKLGFNGTGYFGPSTRFRLVDRQRKNAVRSDGLYAPDHDAATGWDVFEGTGDAGLDVGPDPDERPAVPQGRLDPSTLRFLPPDGDAVLSEDGREVSIVGEGSWRFEANGSVRFEPATGFVGQPTIIEYEIFDTLGARTTGAITIAVEEVNNPPEALADEAVTTEGEPVEITVLENDVDLDGNLDRQSLVFVDTSGRGTLSDDGKKLDIPDEGIWSIDPASPLVTFTPAAGLRDRRVVARYRIADAHGATAEADIEVAVTRRNAPPVAADDSAVTFVGQAVTIDILANDRDDDGILQSGRIGDPDGGSTGRTYAVVTISVEQIQRFAPNAKQTYIDEIGANADSALATHGINANALRVCHFLAQVAHECGGFTIVRESLNYTTAARIKAVWPSRFASIAAALPFVRNERKLANKVYGDRLGNRDPGDGYKYRGRGFLQLTGRTNYEAMEDSLDLPFVDEPDLASEPNEALLIACEVWNDKQLKGERGMNALADDDKLEAITYRINGGYTNLADRKSELARARVIWPDAGEAGASPATSPVLDRGDRGDDVESLQRELRRTGYYSKSVDGRFGYGTYKALRRFKEAVGLENVGYADEATLLALRAAADAVIRRRAVGDVENADASDGDDVDLFRDEPIREGINLAESDEPGPAR